MQFVPWAYKYLLQQNK